MVWKADRKPKNWYPWAQVLIEAPQKRGFGFFVTSGKRAPDRAGCRARNSAGPDPSCGGIRRAARDASRVHSRRPPELHRSAIVGELAERPETLAHRTPSTRLHRQTRNLETA
jgi:hypothetical protein